MIDRILSFFKNFFSKQGLWVFNAHFVSRIASFLVTFIGIKMLSVESFGIISLAFVFLNFFVVLAGWGNNQGILRYGAMLSDPLEREKLYTYSLSYGLIYQLLMTFLMVILGWVIYRHQYHIFYFILFFTIRYVGVYFLENKKAEFRANFNNKTSSLVEMTSAVFGLFSCFILTFFFKEIGYIISLCITPYTSLLYGKLKLSFYKPVFKDFSLREFWKYSITTSISVQVYEFIFLLDIFMIGLMMGERSVAEYRVNTIIPLNLPVIGYIFLQTEYPKLCKNYKDFRYQMNYLKNYLSIMSIVCVIILLVGYTFGEQILHIFGKQYLQYKLFTILLWASVSSLMIRIPFTYFLFAIGKSNWNLIIAMFLNLMIVVGLYFLIPKYGLMGVAIYSIGSFTLFGILTAMAYFYEVKRL